jgi:lipoprotein-releasing system permease protein
MAARSIGQVITAFETFIAARYLKAKRRQAIISLITVVSVLGVAAGVMALVIALAINNGFRTSLQRSLLGATPHVVLMEKEPSEGISDWRALCAKLGKLENVRAAEPALYGKVLLSGPMQSAEATVKGMPLDTSEFRAHIRQGDASKPGLVLGTQLARRIGMRPGDMVTLLSPQGSLTPFGMRARQMRLRVAAIFESGFYDLDNQFAFTNLAEAQRIFSLGDVVNSIELRLVDLEQAPETARLAEGVVPRTLGATHWMEQNRQLLSALKMEKRVSVITISLIQLVAALNILTALFMMVMEKRRDIAVLISMGARRAQIARIFISQGLMIASAGIVLGLVLGYGLSFLAGHYQWIPLDEELYSLSYVPFEANPWDALWIIATALLVSLAATLYPARAATKITPVETLRYE